MADGGRNNLSLDDWLKSAGDDSWSPIEYAPIFVEAGYNSLKLIRDMDPGDKADFIVVLDKAKIKRPHRKVLDKLLKKLLEEGGEGGQDGGGGAGGHDQQPEQHSSVHGMLDQASSLQLPNGGGVASGGKSDDCESGAPAQQGEPPRPVPQSAGGGDGDGDCAVPYTGECGGKSDDSEAKAKSLQEPEDKCAYIFDTCDRDKDGYLNVLELQNFVKLTSMGVNTVNEQEAIAMMQIFADRLGLDERKGLNKEHLRQAYELEITNSLLDVDFETVKAAAELQGSGGMDDSVNEAGVLRGGGQTAVEGKTGGVEETPETANESRTAKKHEDLSRGRDAKDGGQKTHGIINEAGLPIDPLIHGIVDEDSESCQQSEATSCGSSLQSDGKGEHQEGKNEARKARFCVIDTTARHSPTAKFQDRPLPHCGVLGRYEGGEGIEIIDSVYLRRLGMFTCSSRTLPNTPLPPFCPRICVLLHIVLCVPLVHAC